MSAAVPFPNTLRTRDGLDLVTQHWPLYSPSNGVAVLVHGLGEHVRRYAHVAHYLQQQGWAVVGQDHRGHGLSPGKRGVLHDEDDLLHDLALLIDAARAAYPGLPLLLVGHSLGGAVAARFVAATAEPSEHAIWARPVDALVLSSPALKVSVNSVQKVLLSTLGKLAPDLAVANGLKPDWVCNNPTTVQAYVNDTLVHDRVSARLTHFVIKAGAVARQKAPSWTTPTLIMWGGMDRCVMPEGSAFFAAHGHPAFVTARLFPTLSHEIFNEIEQDQVLASMGQWLSTRAVKRAISA